MDYEMMVTITQSVALIFFFGLFVLVLGYVFWPGNKEKFDRASRLPFEQGGANQNRKG
jgi:cytochrome c oxidase cbb3-type subunit 4